MLKINSDLPIEFRSIRGWGDTLHKDSSEERLFSVIKEYLRGKNPYPYVLGKIGNHEEFCLLCQDGYWIVGYSERGSTRFLGIFFDEGDATEFFLLRILRLKPLGFPWETVFE